MTEEGHRFPKTIKIDDREGHRRITIDEDLFPYYTHGDVEVVVDGVHTVVLIPVITDTVERFESKKSVDA